MSTSPPLTIVEAAEAFGVHPKTVRRWIAAGRLPAYRVGPKLLRVNAADVAALARPLATAATVR